MGDRPEAERPIEPEALRRHYSAFLRPGRILMTGHSHQAWPDVARQGLEACFQDAAAHVDEKWARALECADDIRRAVASRIGARPEDIALGQSVHELACRFLSALDWRRGQGVVTTAGEFHSLSRQLRRLAEAGVGVTTLPTDPVGTLAARLAAKIRPGTAAVLVSVVMYETGARVPGLAQMVRAANRVGAAVFLDAYHAFNVVPLTVEQLGPDPIFVAAGGYKYAQWGEGVCWMRVPPRCRLRPLYTGWFAALDELRARPGGPLSYGRDGARRFAGSTYDPASHYRARAVDRFFSEQGLTVRRLRDLSLRQTGRLIAGIEGLDRGLVLATPREAQERAGFVAVHLSGAARVADTLRARGVHCDARGSLLRLGPAPYTTDAEIDAAVAALGAVSADMNARPGGHGGP